MSSIESWLRISVAGLLMAVTSALFFVLMMPLLPWRVLRIKCCNIYGSIAGRIMVWPTGARPIFHNRDKLDAQKPAIFLSNHSSTLDMWVGMWVCPMGGCGLAKKEIRFVPGVGQLYLLSGHPMIDRSNRERAIATLSEVAHFIKKNKLSFWMWPEGTRSKDGQLQEFKKGFAHAALATGLPIVPVVIHNAAKIFPRGKLKFNPGPLDIEILSAIPTTKWQLEHLDEHVASVRRVFLERLEAGPPNSA
jgi:1-acyl-sn-glycerol-3-phosphate acyltransferase